MSNNDENYTFPWGFHLGDLHNDAETIPLYTTSNDGGFCLLYDAPSEAKVDHLLESLCLELLSSMPHGSLDIHLFDVGKKKFYNLSPLQYIELYKPAFTAETMSMYFTEIENSIFSRYQDLLCCNRQDISEHNQKSRHKQMYHLVLLNLEDFPTEDIALRRIQNFVESAYKAGVYVLAFGNEKVLSSESENLQTILKHFKNISVKEGAFAINKEIFEFVELLDDHTFKPLKLDKASLMQKVLMNADLETRLDPANIKLEENTKVH